MNGRFSGIFPWRHFLWMAPLLALEFGVVRGCRDFFGAGGGAGVEVGEVEAGGGREEEEEEVVVPVWAAMVPPTRQKELMTPDAPGVLQPTASGRVESAKFGSVRTGQVKGRLVARFHEGVDIAPTGRDRRGEATDAVFSVAAGRVAFVNGKVGNSDYGRYVVVEHADPSLGVRTNGGGRCVTGMVYTLYGHLAEVKFGIRAGREVKAGEELGRMGHSAAGGIPVERSHVHWEIGLMLNPRYAAYARANQMANLMGAYNGLNLFGVDPLDFFAAHVRDAGLTFRGYLGGVPVAMEVLVRRGHFPDYFTTFPALWEGARGNGEPFYLALSENGLPLRGRLATAAEAEVLGNQRQGVLRVDAGVLGRNGRGLVRARDGGWELTEKGLRHLDLLFY